MKGSGRIRRLRSEVEYWNIGYVSIIDVQYSNIPIFHYSIIPLMLFIVCAILNPTLIPPHS